MPKNALQGGIGASKKRTSPISAKMTSAACVASTAAISALVLARLLAYKKSVVATMPEKKATAAVFATCEIEGGGGVAQTINTNQKGTEPKESKSTL